MEEALGAATAMLSLFGGISLLVWTSTKAKIARIRADAEANRGIIAPMSSDPVLAELKAMRQQIDQMQTTSHQFDISFDAALSRLEDRVSRVEVKVAAVPTASPQTEEVQHMRLR